MDAYIYFPSRDFGRLHRDQYTSFELYVHHGHRDYVVSSSPLFPLVYDVYTATAEAIHCRGVFGPAMPLWIPETMPKRRFATFVNTIFHTCDKRTYINVPYWDEACLFAMSVDLQNRFEEPVDEWDEPKIIAHWATRCVNPWDYDFEMKCADSPAKTILTNLSLRYGLDVRKEEDFNAPQYRRQRDRDIDILLRSYAGGQ